MAEDDKEEVLLYVNIYVKPSISNNNILGILIFTWR